MAELIILYSYIYLIVLLLVLGSQLITKKFSWSQISLNLCSALCLFYDMVLKSLHLSKYSGSLT